MNLRYLMALPLAVTLIIPAAAQQANSASQKSSSQPAQTQATSSSTDEQNLSAHQPLEPQTREGFWGHLNPFARKRFVRRQLDPIRNRMNELDELTAKNARDIRDADTRASASGTLLRETARHLAVRMSYEDVIRVAQAKLDPARFIRIAKEMQVGAGEPFAVVEFLKPGMDELASMLPPRLARAWCLSFQEMARRDTIVSGVRQVWHERSEPEKSLSGSFLVR